MQRCHWVDTSEIYQRYHDDEWGKPCFDESALFEQLCLEGQQAGLSWIIVLKKRENYRKHFFNYDINHIAQFSDVMLAEKCQDTGLIRHFAKLKAIRDNAQAWLNMNESLKQQNMTMVEWLWCYVDNHPIYYSDDNRDDLILISQQMAKALKKKGFKFVGATTCYAFMQAVGMIHSHEKNCFCYMNGS